MALRQYNRVVDGMKTCRDCGSTLPETAFPMDGRWLGSRCRGCRNAFSRAQRKAHPERDRAYYARTKGRQQDRSRAYYEANRDRLLTKALEKQKSDPLYVCLRQLRRRARKAAAPGTCSKEQLQARIAYYGGKCWMCGNAGATVDHVIPLAHGGSNWPANLRPACRRCNCSKGARKPSELERVA